MIIRAKDLCVAVSELGKAAKPDLSDSSRLDEFQLSLVQGMAKLGDALHGVIQGNETRTRETWRAEILGIRQEIVDAMSRFRQKQ